jgi:hypothetical protein
VHNGIIFILSLISISAFGQIGGRSAFDFLNVSPTARLSALGGVNVSLADKDLNFFAANPALAGDTLNGVASANYQFYVADIGQSFFSYGHHFKKVGQLIFGIQHMGYGDIKGFDASGIETSQFRSGETALILGKTHQAGNFRLGANLKGVTSSIAGYKASAILMDLGGVFIHPREQFSVGLLIKNFGFVMRDYSSTGNSNLPFDVQLGTTFKPAHMPLRFSVTAYNMTRPDVTYYNPGPDEKKPGTLVKVFSHINLGTEILIHKNVTVMAGYNYLVHQALKLNGGGGGAGLSLGFAAMVRSFEFIFSRSAYVAGNAGYSFTLSTNVNKLLMRR